MNNKHLLQMLIACVAVIGVAALLITLVGAGGNSPLLLALLFLCPLSHLLMMRSMKHETEGHANMAAQKDEETTHANCH